MSLALLNAFRLTHCHLNMTIDSILKMQTLLDLYTATHTHTHSQTGMWNHWERFNRESILMFDYLKQRQSSFLAESWKTLESIDELKCWPLDCFRPNEMAFTLQFQSIHNVNYSCDEDLFCFQVINPIRLIYFNLFDWWKKKMKWKKIKEKPNRVIRTWGSYQRWPILQCKQLPIGFSQFDWLQGM